jgi:O-antigen ligase
LKAFLGNPYLFFNFLLFSERYVYWVAGWNVFNLHPFIGVGLGNAGFYFQKQLPAYSWALPEVMEIYYRANSLPNIKSFWVRLLAETGITGFASFLAWFYVMMRSGWSLLKKSSSLLKAIGWSGLFVLIAFVVEGFSIDTFALPYLWVSLGIVSAARALSRNVQTETGGD